LLEAVIDRTHKRIVDSILGILRKHKKIIIILPAGTGRVNLANKILYAIKDESIKSKVYRYLGDENRYLVMNPTETAEVSADDVKRSIELGDILIPRDIISGIKLISEIMKIKNLNVDDFVIINTISFLDKKALVKILGAKNLNKLRVSIPSLGVKVKMRRDGFLLKLVNRPEELRTKVAGLISMNTKWLSAFDRMKRELSAVGVETSINTLISIGLGSTIGLGGVVVASIWAVVNSASKIGTHIKNFFSSLFNKMFSRLNRNFANSIAKLSKRESFRESLYSYIRILSEFSKVIDDDFYEPLVDIVAAYHRMTIREFKNFVFNLGRIISERYITKSDIDKLTLAVDHIKTRIDMIYRKVSHYIPIETEDMLKETLGISACRIIETIHIKKLVNKAIEAVLKGKNIVIVGPAGSGKTILLYLILKKLHTYSKIGLMKPDVVDTTHVEEGTVIFADDLSADDVLIKKISKTKGLRWVVITMDVGEYMRAREHLIGFEPILVVGDRRIIRDYLVANKIGYVERIISYSRSIPKILEFLPDHIKTWRSLVDELNRKMSLYLAEKIRRRNLSPNVLAVLYYFMLVGKNNFTLRELVSVAMNFDCGEEILSVISFLIPIETHIGDPLSTKYSLVYPGLLDLLQNPEGTPLEAELEIAKSKAENFLSKLEVAVQNLNEKVSKYGINSDMLDLIWIEPKFDITSTKLDALMMTKDLGFLIEKHRVIVITGESMIGKTALLLKLAQERLPREIIFMNWNTEGIRNIGWGEYFINADHIGNHEWISYAIQRSKASKIFITLKEEVAEKLYLDNMLIIHLRKYTVEEAKRIIEQELGKVDTSVMKVVEYDSRFLKPPYLAALINSERNLDTNWPTWFRALRAYATLIRWINPEARIYSEIEITEKDLEIYKEPEFFKLFLQTAREFEAGYMVPLKKEAELIELMKTKNIIVIEGLSGTGKTTMALKIAYELMKNGWVAEYISAEELRETKIINNKNLDRPIIYVLDDLHLNPRALITLGASLRKDDYVIATARSEYPWETSIRGKELEKIKDNIAKIRLEEETYKEMISGLLVKAKELGIIKGYDHGGLSKLLEISRETVILAKIYLMSLKNSFVTRRALESINFCPAFKEKYINERIAREVLNIDAPWEFEEKKPILLEILKVLAVPSKYQKWVPIRYIVENNELKKEILKELFEKREIEKKEESWEFRIPHPMVASALIKCYGINEEEEVVKYINYTNRIGILGRIAKERTLDIEDIFRRLINENLDARIRNASFIDLKDFLVGLLEIDNDLALSVLKRIEISLKNRLSRESLSTVLRLLQELLMAGEDPDAIPTIRKILDIICDELDQIIRKPELGAMILFLIFATSISIELAEKALEKAKTKFEDAILRASVENVLYSLINLSFDGEIIIAQKFIDSFRDALLRKIVNDLKPRMQHFSMEALSEFFVGNPELGVIMSWLMMLFSVDPHFVDDVIYGIFGSKFDVKNLVKTSLQRVSKPILSRRYENYIELVTLVQIIRTLEFMINIFIFRLTIDETIESLDEEEVERIHLLRMQADTRLIEQEIESMIRNHKAAKIAFLLHLLGIKNYDTARKVLNNIIDKLTDTDFLTKIDPMDICHLIILLAPIPPFSRIILRKAKQILIDKLKKADLSELLVMTSTIKLDPAVGKEILRNSKKYIIETIRSTLNSEGGLDSDSAYVFGTILFNLALIDKDLAEEIVRVVSNYISDYFKTADISSSFGILAASVGLAAPEIAKDFIKSKIKEFISDLGSQEVAVEDIEPIEPDELPEFILSILGLALIDLDSIKKLLELPAMEEFLRLSFEAAEELTQKTMLLELIAILNPNVAAALIEKSESHLVEYFRREGHHAMRAFLNEFYTIRRARPDMQELVAKIENIMKKAAEFGEAN